jgi:hypothetical protein
VAELSYPLYNMMLATSPYSETVDGPSSISLLLLAIVIKCFYFERFPLPGHKKKKKWMTLWSHSQWPFQ